MCIKINSVSVEKHECSAAPGCAALHQDVQPLLFSHSCIIPIRDIPMPLVSSGVEHGNLRELALARMKDMGTEVRL